MIGVVTHSYPNGSFTVYFAQSGFGAKGFSKAVPEGERFEPGDFVECEFSPGGQGTVIRAVRVVAPRALPKAEVMAPPAKVERTFLPRPKRWDSAAAAQGEAAASPLPKGVPQMGYHVK
ncbi:MAG: hypothetical protein Q27BPR15_08745 [Rhodobacter sp. CACIA14H1]|nr:MAG: hypothetical protein Q27BPR15_08745 [Rhodobacter sp. CACIA14H1]